MSYSIYSVHVFIFGLFIQPARPFSALNVADGAIRLLVAIAFTLLVSYSTYRLIEMPARKSLRIRLAGWATAAFGGRADNRLGDGRTAAFGVWMLVALAAFLAACASYQVIAAHLPLHH